MAWLLLTIIFKQLNAKIRQMRGNQIICFHFDFERWSKLNNKIQNYDVWIYSKWAVIPQLQYLQPHLGPPAHQFHYDLTLLFFVGGWGSLLKISSNYADSISVRSCINWYIEFTLVPFWSPRCHLWEWQCPRWRWRAGHLHGIVVGSAAQHCGRKWRGAACARDYGWGFVMSGRGRGGIFIFF